ncbi:unnamed protein product [Calypogeia fissa]
MAATGVSCSLVSRGCVDVRAVSAQSAVISSSIGSKSLVWDPLNNRRHAMLHSSRSAYLSASSAPSTSFAFTGKVTETQRSSRLRWAAPRASNRDEEVEEMTKISEDRLKAYVVDESVETSPSMWSQFLTSAAKPAVVAVMMAAVLLAQPVADSLAASSGGRMGGKAFSSAPRPSGPSRSYSGGGGRGYSGGGLYVAPPIYGSPYGFSPFGYSPFYGGGYGGGFFGPSIGFGGGGTIILAMIAFATVRAVVGFIRDRFSGDDDDRFDD